MKKSLVVIKNSVDIKVMLFCLFSVGVLFFLWADMALAQNDLGGVADTLNEQVGNLGNLARNVAMLAGFILVIVGFIKLNSSRQQQQGVGAAVALIAIGFMLVSIGAVISMGSGTFFGEDKSFEEGNIFD